MAGEAPAGVQADRCGDAGGVTQTGRDDKPTAEWRASDSRYQNARGVLSEFLASTRAAQRPGVSGKASILALGKRSGCDKSCSLPRDPVMLPLSNQDRWGTHWRLDVFVKHSGKSA